MPLLPTRFVVLSGPRTGSTLLGSLLAAHPQVAWRGEYYKRLRATVGHSLRGQLLLRLARHSPVTYLTWTALRSQRLAFGCKFMPGYVPDIESVVPHLYRYGWRIIFLQRQAVFRAVLSSLVAQAAHHWGTRQDKPAPEPPRLAVEPAAFLKKLSDHIQEENRHQRSVAGIPHLKVNYENDLAEAACWPATMARVFEYLDLPNVPVQSLVSKTWNRPYQEIITNYAELEAAVRGSQWAYVLSSVREGE